MVKVSELSEKCLTPEHKLVDLTWVEKQAITDCEALLAAKAKEIATNTQSLKAKVEKSGLVSVDIFNLVEAFDNSTKSLRADKTSWPIWGQVARPEPWNGSRYQELDPKTCCCGRDHTTPESMRP